MRASSTIVFVSLCFSATLLSALPAILSHPPTQFLPVSFETGFPFQWYIQPASQGMAHCGPTGHCTLFTFRNPSPLIDVPTLLLDSSIYALIAAGIMTAYRASITISRRLKAVP